LTLFSRVSGGCDELGCVFDARPPLRN